MENGTRLGPYEVQEQLGAGGMGEVWLASDTRLGRQVAIKTLPEEYASVPERLARFEQEARAAAALNHPHIAVVYDIGAAEGVHFIVQELLKGQPLQDVLAEGRMSLDRVLEFAVEVVEALAAAHAAGIVHRDLKPANLFVSPEGHAKVLDFGLAKLTEVALGSSPGDDRTKSPTMLGTAAGQVMGTAGYMAPEQVEGGDVDGRADVFSFGCVLYEMVTGRRPFAGRSVMQTLDMIVHESPEPLGETDAKLPTQLQWILDKCLAKDRTRRYQGAADLAVDLRRLAADVESGTAQTFVSASAGESAASAPSAPAGLGAGRVAAMLLGTAIISVAAGLWLSPASGPEPRPVGRFRVPLPDGLALSSTGRTAVTISRDGSTLAFSAGDQIWARPLDSFEAYPVRGTTGDNGGRNPVFSPDGTQIVFWADDELRRVPAAGGAALLLAPARNPWGLRWERDGHIYYGQGTDGIWRISEQGGRAEQLVELEPGQMAHGGQPLADGSLLFTLRESSADWNDARVVVRSPAGEIRELVNPGRDGRLLPSGHLVYVQGNRLLAVPAEAGSLRPLGAPVVALEGLRGSVNLTATGQFGVSDTGTLAYLPGSDESDYERQLGWMTLDGTFTLLGEYPASMDTLAVSSDAGYAVGLDSNDTIWSYDLVRGTSQVLVSAEGDDALAAAQGRRYFASPLFTPDGRHVVYGAGGKIMRIAADRSGPAEEVFGVENKILVPDSFTADGTLAGRLLENGVSGTQAFVSALEPGAEPEIVAQFRGYVETIRISPDGRHVAYSSDESGAAEVFLRALATGATLPISAGGGVDPRWSADGNQLYFVIPRSSDPSSLAVVDITDDGTVAASPPRESVASVAFVSWEYELAAATGQFLVAGWMLDEQGPRTQEIRVVTEWFDDLSRRAPVSR